MPHQVWLLTYLSLSHGGGDTAKACFFGTNYPATRSLPDFSRACRLKSSGNQVFRKAIPVDREKLLKTLNGGLQISIPRVILLGLPGKHTSALWNPDSGGWGHDSVKLLNSARYTSKLKIYKMLAKAFMPHRFIPSLSSARILPDAHPFPLLFFFLFFSLKIIIPRESLLPYSLCSMCQFIFLIHLSFPSHILLPRKQPLHPSHQSLFLSLEAQSHLSVASSLSMSE